MFVLVFIFLNVIPATICHPRESEDPSPFTLGYQDGYRDAMDGVQSMCATRRCISQDPYERGYKLGYKKGIKERGLIEPNTDSPGKTIGSDFNGDGIHDFLVSAYTNDDGPGANNAGAAYIFFGASSLSGTKSLGEGQSADVTFLGKASTDQLGRSSSAAGDVNGDGFDDIILGAYTNDDGAANAGAAYIFFGASNLSGTKSLGGGQSADVTVLGKAASDFLGFSVSEAGDVNGDGFDDVIVGAYTNDDGPGIDAGTVYIFFGASTLSGTKRLGGGQSADVTILGKAAYDKLGISVSGAGDLNGDGFDDVIMGAQINDDGPGLNAGAAYIFFGASALSGTKSLGGGQSADVTVLGKADSDYLGFSVSGVGDVNGDGFDDVIVGARLNDDGPGNTAGAAYIFFGASTLSGTKSLGEGQSADVTFLGKADGDRLSFSVSGAGDLNDDGFDDVIVGSHVNDDGPGIDAGAAYIFFGASTLSGTKSLGEGQSADVTVLGKADSDFLGVSASGAGDLNGDGLPDFSVGAHLNNDGPGTNNAGAAYIFFGSSSLSGTKALESVSADVTILGKAASDQLGRSVGGGRSNPGP